MDTTPQKSNEVLPATRRVNTKHFLIILIFIIMAVCLICGAWLHFYKTTSPIPKTVRNSVNFPVFYPDPKQLPSGYALDVNSFKNPQKNNLVYHINFGNSQKLVFSEQEKPSSDDIQNFYANYIPLRNKLEVPAGHVEIGAYNNKGTILSVFSLPIDKSNTWLIITGPADYNKDQLEQILKSIKS